MIFDRIDSFDYFDNPAIKKALRFIGTLSPDTPEGEYEIEGAKIFARVARYETLSRDKGRYEAHKKYADIQVLLSGSEIIQWMPLDEMPQSEYDAEADVSFYPVPDRSRASLELRGGFFALFMPADAHMPMLAVEGRSAPVTKVVVKIDVSLL